MGPSSSPGERQCHKTRPVGLKSQRNSMPGVWPPRLHHPRGRFFGRILRVLTCRVKFLLKVQPWFLNMGFPGAGLHMGLAGGGLHMGLFQGGPGNGNATRRGHGWPACLLKMPMCTVAVCIAAFGSSRRRLHVAPPCFVAMVTGGTGVARGLPALRQAAPASSQCAAASSQGVAALSQGVAASSQGLQASSQGVRVSGPDRYRRLDEGSGLGAVAKGSFGRVYIAVDKVTGATVAVKRQPLPCSVASAELAFYKALSQSPHPHIVPLLDHFVASERFLYLVFELLDCDLWSLWKSRRRLLPLRQAGRFMKHIVGGVGHLHGLGIVHADLSMGNMLISHGQSTGIQPRLWGRLQIADMGSATCAQRMVLAPGEVITTEYARAPEIFLGAREFTEAVDVWAVGIVGVALWCGSMLFWRPVEHESPHSGFEPRADSEDAWESNIANLVAVLGTLSSDVWPGVEALPAWGQVSHITGRPSMYDGLGCALADSSLVRRPMEMDSPAASLLSAWLQWRPESRLPAKASLGSACLREVDTPPPFAMDLANAASSESLRLAAVQSWWTGTPIDLEQLGATGSVAGQGSGESCPAWSQGAGATLAALMLASGEAPNEPHPAAGVKRLRLWKKTAGFESSTCAGATSGVEPREQPPASRLCECHGHCGRRTCRRGQARRCRNNGDELRICSNPALPGERFCVWCKCELCPSGRQQCHGDGRLCTSCCGGLDRSSKRVYFNKWGVWSFGKAWSQELRCSARLAFATSLLPAVDWHAWQQFLREFDAIRARRRDDELMGGLHTGDIAFLCLVGLVKWPSLTRQALSQLSACGVDPRSATASDWRLYLLGLIKLADGAPVQAELSSISPGRTAVATGLIWFAKRLGILHLAAAGSEPIGGCRLHSLGCGRQLYAVLPEQGGVDKLTAFLDAVRAASLEFPASGQAAPASGQAAWSQAASASASGQAASGQAACSQASCLPPAREVTRFVEQVQRLTGSLCGGNSKLAAGGLARRLLAVLEHRHGEAVWDECPMSVLNSALPDINGHARPLGDMLAGDVRRQFGMSPLVASATACLWGAVDSASRSRALEARYLDILRAVEKCNMEFAQPKDWMKHLA